jgi:hypothetical protein
MPIIYAPNSQAPRLARPSQRTANFTAVPNTAYDVNCYPNASSITVTLPTAALAGDQVVIRKTYTVPTLGLGGPLVVTLTPGGSDSLDLLAAGASQAIAQDWQTVTLRSNGAGNWATTWSMPQDSSGNMYAPYPTNPTSSQLATTQWVADRSTLYKWHVVGNAGEPTLVSPWADYANWQFAPARFRKDEVGCVYLSGLVWGGSGTIFTLPVGLRPAYTLIFPAVANGQGEVRVDPSGNVSMYSGANQYVSLDQINFMAEDVNPPTWHLLTPLSPWTNYGAPGAPLRYCIDAIGEVHVSGLVAAAGNPTGGTGKIVQLPAGLGPSWLSMRYVPAYSNGGRLDIDTSGNFVMQQYATGASSGYVSLEGISYPNSTSDSYWRLAGAFANGWVNYGSWGGMAFTKNKLGLVRLRGLIASGTAGTITPNQGMTVDYHPGAEGLFMGWAGPGPCRIDPGFVPGSAPAMMSGQIAVMNYYNGGTNAYVAMDGIHWLAAVGA